MELEEARKHLPPIWTVYDHPEDFPDKFVVRVAYGLIKEPQSSAHDSLQDARESIWSRGGSFCLGRDPSDAPCIVESWI